MANRKWAARQEALRRLLRDLRIAHGLTQVALAAKLAKPQSYVSKYESGERKLDLIEVADICRACGSKLSKFAAQLEATEAGQT